MELTLPYGRGTRHLALPPGVRCDTLMPLPLPPLADPVSATRAALRHAIGSRPLREIVRPSERVAVLVNDITRLVRSDLFLPVLTDELNEAGVPDRDIFIVFALGIHRRQTSEEHRRIVGHDVARRLALYDHDCNDHENLVHIGHTSRGNEVWINRRVYEADRVILTGEIIYHLIAGYSGGRKSLVPGVAGAETITFNHCLIFDPRCRAGVLEGNPAHEDLVEACQLLRPDFLLNVVLNPKGEWVRIVAGDYQSAHRAGCETVDQMFRVPVNELYDVVVASAGGYPLDIDLRQAHKGLDNAANALRPGGALIYFAECKEGAGSRAFEEWAERFATSDEIEQALRQHFVVGGHKAYWMRRLGERRRIFLISSLPERFARNCRVIPTRDPEAALHSALAEAGVAARVAHIPYAGFTLPTPIGQTVAA